MSHTHPANSSRSRIGRIHITNDPIQELRERRLGPPPSDLRAETR